MIFNLFKSKPTLKEIIPNGFVDIHSHILPGIDDGAKNIEESKIIINGMQKLGFSKIIGTPHTYPGLYDNTNETIKNSFKLLNNNFKKPIELSYASEYLIDASLFEKIEKRSLLTIKDNYVLIEMSFMGKPSILYDMIFKLCINDYIPILAHPERYLFLHDDFRKYIKLKKYNCKFQLNLLSMTGHYGKNILNISKKLIENELIDFTGSDIHNNKHVKMFENKKRENKYLVQIDERKYCKLLETNNIFK